MDSAAANADQSPSSDAGGEVRHGSRCLGQHTSLSNTWDPGQGGLFSRLCRMTSGCGTYPMLMCMRQGKARPPFVEGPFLNTTAPRHCAACCATQYFFLFLCEHMQAARGSSGRQIAVGALRDLRWWSGNQVGLVQECQRPRATMSAHYGETFEAPAGMMHCMSLMHDGCFVGIMPDATVSPPSPQCSWPRALSDSWTRDGLGAWCGVVLSMHEVWPAPGKTNSRATKCHCLELDTVRLKAIGQVKPHPISTSRRKSALRP